MKNVTMKNVTIPRREFNNNNPLYNNSSKLEPKSIEEQNKEAKNTQFTMKRYESNILNLVTPTNFKILISKFESRAQQKNSSRETDCLIS